jgi:hypothetical protein
VRRVTRRPVQALKRSTIAAALALAGCASAPQPGAALDEVRVDSRGADPGGGACGDFALTAAQARYFLARAVVVDTRQLRDGWDVLPCYVRGTARSSAGTWRWEIRAGGTATLETPSGATELRACGECDAVLNRPAGKRRQP